jgi:hypothetical protein
MCDPLIGGLIAGAASLATGAMQSSQLEDVQNAQNQANQQWVSYQNQIHQQQVQAEEEARGKAESARQDTLAKVTPQAQEATQTTEQQRLNSLYTKPGPTNLDPSDPSSLALSGEQTSGNFMDNLTSQVNQATAQARSRIAALATAGSYGGSFGGLGTVVPQQFAAGGNAIQLQNDIRQGNLKTYGVEQQVQPIQYTMGPETSMLGGVAKALGGIAGSGLGAGGAKLFSGGGGFAGVPQITDGWAGGG